MIRQNTCESFDIVGYKSGGDRTFPNAVFCKSFVLYIGRIKFNFCPYYVLCVATVRCPEFGSSKRAIWSFGANHFGCAMCRFGTRKLVLTHLYRINNFNFILVFSFV